MGKSIFSSNVYMCTACGHMMVHGVGKCKKCHSARPLEYYSNSCGAAATQRLRDIQGSSRMISLPGIILLTVLIASGVAYHAGAQSLSLPSAAAQSNVSHR